MDYLAEKGLMNKNTASARKAALNGFLGILSPEEAQDITRLNLDEVATRFRNLKRGSFTPDSLKVYEARARTAIEDFKSFLADPPNFKPPVATTTRAAATSKTEKETAKPAMRFAGGPIEVGDADVFPVRIRQDVVVKLVGIPADLTKPEATKIANVVHALVQVEEVP
jgi:hypothetical protein